MEIIEAFVDETVFRNDDNGYTVLVVKSGKTRVAAVGIMPPVASGEKLRSTGEWVEHPVYGKQIKGQGVEIEKPTTLSGIEKYLASGMIKGIGPARRKALLRAFGSAEAVRDAGLDQLAHAPSMDARSARSVWDFFHPAESAEKADADGSLFLSGQLPGQDGRDKIN